jgi:methylmalonyl-CoA/ethylmalonyl-CoA epimerase
MDQGAAAAYEIKWRFDHLGVVVKSLSTGKKHLTNILQIKQWTQPFTDHVNGVEIQFGQDSCGVVYELLAPIDENSPVYPALKGGKAILNHVAYITDDLEASAKHLVRNGCGSTGEPNPAIAYGGARIQFFVTPLRTIIELVEAPSHSHEFS